MRKLLSMLLCAALCLSGAACAVAEEAEVPQITTTLSFFGDVIYFEEDPEYFVVVPHDWPRAEITEEEAAAGVLVNCTDPDGILALRILYNTDDEHTVEEVYEGFASNPSMTNLTEMYVDDNLYMIYDIPDVGCYCATTTPDGIVYVTYMFSAPNGGSLDDALAALGTVPYEILGQFNDDVEE